MDRVEGQAGGKVLVIDDERTVCLACTRILQEEGYDAEYALSGREGVARAAEGHWDVVLLDLKMPEISGIEALAQIHRAHPEQPVIMITGYATIQTSIEAIKRGAFDYLPKPFSPEELTLSVRRRSRTNACAPRTTTLRNGSTARGPALRSSAAPELWHRFFLRFRRSPRRISRSWSTGNPGPERS